MKKTLILLACMMALAAASPTASAGLIGTSKDCALNAVTCYNETGNGICSVVDGVPVNCGSVRVFCWLNGCTYEISID